ncbi:ceramidase [Frigidibacter sp. ROC022]|uniref:ceramidase n=1 Tax=Frigidibacter sp. ROC022 TaxID=2971796 RepID=UPI00215A5CC0|nr:ceramidase [Frigidibacter sp. ROC022]MCR8726709.1 ceramidase [Frigidibacter sp. ROC022]
MDWTTEVDDYCERLGPGLWAEPLNLLTNAAFLLAALVMARRCRGMPTGQALAAVLALIGLGSGLFHSVATRWAAVADVAPILGFILLYVFAASRDFLGLRPAFALVAAALFLPYAAATLPLFRLIPGIGSSAAYAPVPALILAYALALVRRAPRTAVRLGLGAAMLIVSITFRSLDAPLCPHWPTGTHFLWHLLNGLMLGWMIETWRRHMLEAGPAGR